MDEEDELVGGEEGDSGMEDDVPPPPPEERNDEESAVNAEDGEEDVADRETNEEDDISGSAAQVPEGADEDDEVDLELDSDNSVPYNRQFYAVPNSAIARDYNHPLDVSSVERLSEMAQPTPPPEKWPAPDQIEPSMIVVLRGKVSTNDAAEKFVWYVRIVVAGDQGSEGDDKLIFRHVPKPVVKKLVAHYNADPSLRGSSLLTKYVPYDDNFKPLNPSKLHDNNWNVRKPPPKTLAQTIGKENKPGGSSSTVGKRPAEADVPLSEPSAAKKPKQGTVAPPLSKAPAKAGAAAPKPTAKELGKPPAKSSTPPPASKPKPTQTPAQAPTAAKSKPAAAPVAIKPKSVAAAPPSARTSPSVVPDDRLQKKAVAPAPMADASREVRDAVASSSATQIVPMGGASDIGPSPGHKMTKTITVSNTTYNPDETRYTVAFPPWATEWKITAEFTGDA